MARWRSFNVYATLMTALFVGFGGLIVFVSAGAAKTEISTFGMTPNTLRPFTAQPSRGVFTMGDSLCATAPFRREWKADLARGHWFDAGHVCFGGLSTQAGPGQMRLAPANATVVVSLGTNDAVPNLFRRFRSFADTTLAAAQGRNVIWVLPGVSHRNFRYRYEPTVLHVLEQELAKYPNLRILDWDGEYNRHPHDQLSDGVHATDAGYAMRARYIVASLDHTVPRRTGPTGPSGAAAGAR